MNLQEGALRVGPRILGQPREEGSQPVAEALEVDQETVLEGVLADLHLGVVHHHRDRFGHQLEAFPQMMALASRRGSLAVRGAEEARLGRREAEVARCMKLGMGIFGFLGLSKRPVNGIQPLRRSWGIFEIRFRKRNGTSVRDIWLRRHLLQRGSQGTGNP